jgi:hypothetical protein
MDWLAAPDQGAKTSPLRPLGRNGIEIELTKMPPLFRFHLVLDNHLRELSSHAHADVIVDVNLNKYES